MNTSDSISVSRQQYPTISEQAREMETITMDRYTQFKANFPPIYQPRFHDNTLLIAANVSEHNKVICTYVKADGARMFPEPLYISGRLAKQYKPFSMPTKAGGVMRLRAIPVSEFKILRISERSLYGD